MEVLEDESHQKLYMEHQFTFPTIDTVSDQGAGGASDTHNVVQRSGREDSYPSRSITLEDSGGEAHQEDVIGGSGSG